MGSHGDKNVHEHSLAGAPEVLGGSGLVNVHLIGLVALLVASWAPPAEARSHPAGRNGVSAMVARVLPAVVSITTQRIEKDQANKPVVKAGMGSGVIVDKQGYILTNEHVIRGADEIKVALPDERTFRATLAGSDGFTDLAVLKIEARNLPVAPLGDSSRLPIGDTVVGIGYPLWIEGGPTVTVGIVSGLGRSMEEPDDLDQPMLHNLIQTDAAINPGNSGGPLLNLSGQVIGINVAFMPSAHGIGFAIPINTAKDVFRALVKSGRIVRPSLGLVGISVTPHVASANNLQTERGVLVVQVDPGGPADAVGIRTGDVITLVMGDGVRDLHQFHELLSRRRPGEPVDLIVWRDGQTLWLRPVLREEG